MPQPFNSAVLTTAGARLLTKAQAGQAKIQFTKMSIGNGSYSSGEKAVTALAARTVLKSKKNDFSLSDIAIYKDQSVKVTALFTNKDPVSQQTLISAGYFINEIGLYAKEKDGSSSTEVLYAIAVVAGDTGDFIPPYNGYNPAQIIQDFIVTVNNSTQVTIQSNGAALLAEDANKITDDVTRKKYRLGIADGNLYYEEVAD